MNIAFLSIFNFFTIGLECSGLVATVRNPKIVLGLSRINFDFGDPNPKHSSTRVKQNAANIVPNFLHQKNPIAPRGYTHSFENGLARNRKRSRGFTTTLEMGFITGIGSWEIENTRRIEPLLDFWDRIFNKVDESNENKWRSVEKQDACKEPEPAQDPPPVEHFGFNPKRRKRYRNNNLVRKRETIAEEQAEYKKLHAKLEAWGKSKNKTERQLHDFLKENLHELKAEIEEENEDDDDDETMSVAQFLEALDEEHGAKDLQEAEWLDFLQTTRSKISKKIESMKHDVTQLDLVKKCMDRIQEEEKCGYRYPIVGTPDEIYSDPNIYKAWSSTLLSQVQYTNATRTSGGLVEPALDSLPDEMLSTSPLRNDVFIQQELDKIHLGHLDDLLNKAQAPRVSTELKNVTVMVKSKFDSLLDMDKDSQLDLLRSLNEYNPFDEYIEVKKTSGKLFDEPIQVTMTLGNSIVTDDTVGENCVQRVDPGFVRDYLNAFLMLPKDLDLLKRLESAEYLLDVLRCFDFFQKPPEPDPPQFVDLYDRLIQVIFPDLKGFPEKPKDPEFPSTRTEHKRTDVGRVNANCALMGLVRAQLLAGAYTADLFTEQRMRKILDILERCLVLEMKRMSLGISQMQLNPFELHVEKLDFCVINDAFLGTLSAALSLWNIKGGIENIIDAIIVLTIQKMSTFRAKYLIAVALNLSHVHSLPHAVFKKFMDRIVSHIHLKLKQDVSATLQDANAERWMDFDVATRLMHVLVRHRSSLTREFMTLFLELYKDDYINQKVPPAAKSFIVNVQDEKIAIAEKDIPGWKSIYPKASELLQVMSDGESDQVLYEDVEELGSEIKKYDIDAHAIRGRWLQNLWSLMGCMSWCGLTRRYSALVTKLNFKSYIAEIDFDSVGATAMIETCNDWDPMGSALIHMALKKLMDLRFTMTCGQLLDTIQVYLEATSADNGAKPRIAFDANFVKTMLKNFKKIMGPTPPQLIKAANLYRQLATKLSHKDTYLLFEDLLGTKSTLDILVRLGLNGELLEYPINTISKVLEIAGECRVRIDKAWQNHWEIIEVFLHTLSLEDISGILRAMVTSRYTRLLKSVNALLDRACQLMQVTRCIRHGPVLNILEASLKLNVVPVQLMRWYLYALLRESPPILEKAQETDVDFRGWIRPRTKEPHQEIARIHSNLYMPVEMAGSRVKCPQGLQYALPQHAEDDGFSEQPDKIPNIQLEPLNQQDTNRIIKACTGIQAMDFSLEPADAALVQRALAHLGSIHLESKLGN
ncbi:hypothetical protein BdWA1_000977 [Babesia duncani]|uniref:Uncharacterized protein n=1 Tax=Babesia duncani TaxID=323732 RepID=A0AAD9PHS5_9APIC|nr:hypothetical protein BdWA1_003794 [Babesia duncani]KAK2197973.1 hypothetical protein BdWA1_000977 [Babesia duncani]